MDPNSKTQCLTSIGLFCKNWENCGGVSDCEELSGGYGVIYFTTSLPKAFPSLSFAVPNIVTL